MFRLLKLCAYGLLGYALYEFIHGMMQMEDASSKRSAARPSFEGGRQNRPENITGPEGQGQRVETQDADGGISAHRVGRGVVHR